LQIVRGSAAAAGSMICLECEVSFIFLATAGVGQMKVLDDELPFAGREGSAAASTNYLSINRLSICLNFDDLIKRFASWTIEKR
jgi:hypothetical protein